MVVLTDTPATARAAAEAAAKAAAAAAEAAAAAAADAASDGSDHSSGGSPLASMLRGKKRKSKRFQWESPLLQPIEDSVEDKPAEEEQQHTTVTDNTNGAEIDAGPFAANGLQQQQQDASLPRAFQRSSSSGSRSKGRVGFQELTGLHVSVVSQQDFVVGVSDSSSSLAQLQQSRAAEQQEQQQQLEREGLVPISVERSSSGGSGGSSSKGGLRTRSKSGPMLMSLAIGQEGDGCMDILNGPEGVAVPIGAAGIVVVHQQAAAKLLGRAYAHSDCAWYMMLWILFMSVSAELTIAIVLQLPFKPVLLPPPCHVTVLSESALKHPLLPLRTWCHGVYAACRHHNH